MKIRLITEDLRPTRKTVEYQGNVEVVGTIKSGAKIAIEGDLAVYGNVEDAEVYVSGDTFIDGGFLGTGAGRIACGGNFEARFVQSQTVEARGDITVENGLMACNVYSGGRVFVKASDGKIVGGVVRAYRSVESPLIGSPRPVMTRIDVGVDPVLMLKVDELERRAMELTKKRIGFLKDLVFVSKTTEIDEAEEMRKDLDAACVALQAELMTVGEEIISLRKNAHLDKSATVTARRVCYPPLEISICFTTIVSEAKTGPVVFRLFEDRIVLDTWSLGLLDGE